MRIDYTKHKVNELWKYKIENNPYLTPIEKQQLIDEAKKHVRIENLKEIGIVLLKIAGLFALAGIIAWISGEF